jgi:hypothetical protein
MLACNLSLLTCPGLYYQPVSRQRKLSNIKAKLICRPQDLSALAPLRDTLNSIRNTIFHLFVFYARFLHRNDIISLFTNG